ncbi:MAG: NAD-binding protein [Chloroflexi bacterium]|nr:NAD-binding protein [Chloroflexota bacterium]
MITTSPTPIKRKRRGVRRLLQVVLRDTQALLKEFRWPLLAFLLATFGLGLIYGELLVAAGYPRLPWFELPYVMFALMVLAGPTEIPPEPYLLVFWYVLPPIALIIVGRGAADFTRLFFDRSGRRTAWTEALVSTMRNHTIVLGVGHVGMRVARALTEMGFEVVAVDQSFTPEQETALRGLDVQIITGDGRSAETLAKAGIERAEALVVCTSQDYMNLEMIMRVRDLNPSIRIVTRMWDNQFAAQMKQFLGVSAVISSADIAAPIFAGAAAGIEVTQTLKLHGREYAMFRLTVSEGSYFEGRTIGSVQDRYDVDVVLHGRGDDADVHPDNAVTVAAGDTLVIFAHIEKMRELATSNRVNARGV